jgi:hypothetical protein
MHVLFERDLMTDLLADFVAVKDFAKSIGKTTRCVQFWMAKPNGLPWTSLGATRLIHVPTAREWLIRRMRNHRRASPKPGRPARR